jgi:hypothetical protein
LSSDRIDQLADLGVIELADHEGVELHAR